MREQDRTLECEHSIYGFHKPVNLGERTWNDDLRAMSYGLGIAIVVLVTEQNVILQTAFHGWNVANARPASGHAAAPPISANHSITSSARARTESGISSPSVFAVLRLITSSYLVGACTGRSAGFSPFRMRLT